MARDDVGRMRSGEAWFLLLAWAVNGAAADSTCSCGTGGFRSRIIGGDESTDAYPWMSTLHYQHVKIVFCGASVIGNKYALSAAHCTQERDHGLLALGVGSNDYFEAKEYPLKTVIEHANFNEDSTATCDIAILVTRRKIDLGDLVAPICLPGRKLDHSIFGTLKLLGWGWTMDKSRKMSRKLREVDVQVISLQECSDRLNGLVDPEPPTQLCTYSEGKDSCQGDSGGPVIYLDPESQRYILVGLVSYGQDCGGKYPSVNTDVSVYLDWIWNKIRETSENGRSTEVCFFTNDERSVDDTYF